MELDVLAKLDYVIGLPTPFTFLRTLYIRHRADTEASLWFSLAAFLLELALFDPKLEYDYPHAHLAGAALSTAFRVFQAPPIKREQLLEDVAAYWPDGDPSRTGVAELVLDCE